MTSPRPIGNPLATPEASGTHIHTPVSHSTDSVPSTSEPNCAHHDHQSRKPLRLLVVEDSAFDAELIERQLTKAGYWVTALRADSAAAFANALAAGEWDVVIADYTIPGFGAIPALELLRESKLDIPFIIVSGTITDEIAVASMRAGAHDYVVKDHIARLVPAIEREMQEAQTRQEKRAAEDAVRHLSAIVESSHDAIIGKTLEGIVTSWNRGAERLYGYTAAEMLGKPISILVPPDVPDDIEIGLRRLARGEQIDYYEAVRRRKDGTLVDVAIKISPILDTVGNVIGASGIARDISDRKKAEAELQHSRTLLAEAERLSHTGAWEWGINADQWTFSVEWLAIHGCEQPPANGAELLRLAHPEDRAAVTVAFENVRKGVAPYEIEHRIVRQDTGAVRTVHARGRYECNACGDVVKVYGFAQDITERKQSEEALRQSEQRFRAMAENVPEMMWVVDEVACPQYLSPKWLHYTGTTMEQNRGGGVWNSVHPDDRTDALGRWNAAVSARANYEAEYRLRRYDGEYRWHLSRAVPIADPNTNANLWFGTTIDVENQKRGQEALIRSEKLASVGRMAATIAHEINNPLASAMNAIFLASVNPSIDEAGHKNLELAERELERVAHLAKQTLGFYRETGQRRAVELKEVIDGTLDLYGPKLKNRGVSVQRRFRSTSPVLAIEGELRQVVSNLVANSIDAMNETATLHVRTSGPAACNGDGPMVRLTIADNGSGISPEDLKRVFEPFFTTKEAIGTGLGLWVTKELVHKHEGRIRVRSRVGKGTVFSIWLPADRRRQPRVEQQLTA